MLLDMVTGAFLERVAAFGGNEVDTHTLAPNCVARSLTNTHTCSLHLARLDLKHTDGESGRTDKPSGTRSTTANARRGARRSLR